MNLDEFDMLTELATKNGRPVVFVGDRLIGYHRGGFRVTAFSTLEDKYGREVVTQLREVAANNLEELKAKR